VAGRSQMHGWFVEALATRAALRPAGCHWVTVEGTPEQRVKAAVGAIQPLLQFPTLTLASEPELLEFK
jgi:hypothetical protein